MILTSWSHECCCLCVGSHYRLNKCNPPISPKLSLLWALFSWGCWWICACFRIWLNKMYAEIMKRVQLLSAAQDGKDFMLCFFFSVDISLNRNCVFALWPFFKGHFSMVFFHIPLLRAYCECRLFKSAFLISSTGSLSRHILFCWSIYGVFI